MVALGKKYRRLVTQIVAQAEGAPHPQVRSPLPTRVGWESPGPSSEEL